MDKKSRELVMAKLYFKNKDYKLAEKSFNEYLSMQPNDVTALKLLAQVYEQNKRFDKAFEMYERCYLAEPERTGVLLDICRMLSMNEIWLENVDYRRWLNLAIKAFPSNPIVVNFKAFLSTSPSDEVLPRETHIHKVSNEDPLSKILEKLSTMEKRLENIEQKIGNLSISEATKEKSIEETPKKPDAVRVQPSPVAINNASEKSNDASVYRNFETPISIPEKPNTLVYRSPETTNNVPDKPNTPVYRTSETLSSISEKPYTPVFGGFKFNQAESTPPKYQPPTLFSGLKASPQSDPITTNLFAESLKRLNIPSSSGGTTAFGSNFSFNFSSPTPKDTFLNTNTKIGHEAKGEASAEGDEEGDEVSHNEELPIENTCDMEPIVIKTGEEDEDKLFENRCKLYRFRDKEYKERGVGSIKVLKHKDTGKGRLTMRREAIGLVCLNCSNCSNIQRVKDTQIKWTGMDASDGEAEATVFVVRFKTPELTDTFMTHMNSLFSESPLPDAQVSSNASDKPDVIPISEPPTTNLFAESLKRLELSSSSGGPMTFGSNFSFNFSSPTPKDAFLNTNTKIGHEAKGEASAEGDEEGDEVSHNEELPIENTCNMEPIVIKTGEEDEDKLFENRCKLYRFRDKEYKERGVGSIKVLKHKDTGKGRLTMRREAIGLVCLNCSNCSNIQRVKDTQIKWTGMDASDGEAEATVFVVRFKTPELTDTFMTHMNSLFSETPVQDAQVTSNASDKPDVELVDPQLDQDLVDRARMFQLPDLFYHKLKNQEPCSGCNGCEKDN